MKRLTQIALLSLAPTFALAGTPNSSGDTEKMKTLFQCGVGTEKGFEGWKINGKSHETITYFEKDHIELFNHNPGNFSISFEKKIDELVGFSDLQLSAEIEEIENCRINTATAYLSADGKNWTALNKDAREGATTFTEKMNYLFLKLVADVTFYSEGRFRLNKAAVYGDYSIDHLSPDANLGQLRARSSMNHMRSEFFVFSFQKSVNIETQSENDYDFVVSNLQGQVIMKTSSNGSRRFPADLPDGIYFVTIIQDGRLVKTKKIVL